jgi:hypothetical protein
MSARHLDILIAARQARAAIERLLDVTGWGHEPALSRALDAVVVAEDLAAAALRKGRHQERRRPNTKPTPKARTLPTLEARP